MLSGSKSAKWFGVVTVVALLAPTPFALQAPQAPLAPGAFDILIRNGRVLDGSGNPWYRADIGITGDRIRAMGMLADATAKTVIDAGDRYVTPGFIDVHSHAGPGLASAELKQGQPVLAQGITTVLINPDGGGPTDLAAQRATYEKQHMGPNVGLFVPHGSIRNAVMGMSDRDPNAAELDRMIEMTRAGMRAGGVGLSSGLYYAPGSYSKTAEVIAMAKATAPFGGVYASHIRDEADYTIGVVGAVDEVIAIAEGAGVTGVVTHMKALGPKSWGLSKTLIDHIEAARARGTQIFADQYPYEASGTSIVGALMPRSAQVGGRDAMLKRITGELRPEIRAEVKTNLARRGGADTFLISEYRARPVDRGAASVRPRRTGRAPARRVRVEAARERQRRARVIQHDGAGHRAHHATGVDDDVHRRRPAADDRGQAAPARVRRVSAEARALCARAPDRGSAVCDSLDDFPAGNCLWLEGPRRAARRRVRRCADLQPQLGA